MESNYDGNLEQEVRGAADRVAGDLGSGRFVGILRVDADPVAGGAGELDDVGGGVDPERKLHLQ